jgi:MFS family permease
MHLISSQTIVTLGLGVALVAGIRGIWSPCGLSMLSSLNPVSERARGHRFSGTAVWYLLGAALGGALLGAGCAAGSYGYAGLHPADRWTWALVLGAAVLAVASDARTVPFALPDHPRQVDERWLARYRRWIYAGGYGIQIGTGLATYIMTAGVYLVAALAVLSADPSGAFVIGLAFGVARGLGILLVARAGTPAALRALLARLDALDGSSLRVAGLASAAVAATAGWTLGGPAAGLPIAAALTLLTLAPAPAMWWLSRRKVDPPAGEGGVQGAAAA